MSLRSFPRLYFELIFVGFTIIMGMSLSTSFLPILARDLDPSGILVGLVVSAWFLSRVFIELPAGIISDRIGRRKLLIAGVGLGAIGAFLCARADNIYLLIFGRAVWGLGTALYFMNNTALIIDLFDPKVRGHALGVFNGIEFIGSFIGAPIGAFLAGLMSYTNVFYFTLVLILTSLAIAATSGNLKAVGGRQREVAGISVRQTLKGLQDLGIIIICISSFFRMFVMQGVFSTILELYFKEELLFPLTYIGLIMSLRTAGHIIATISSGFLSNKLGRRLVVIAGLLTGAGCLAAFTVVSNLEIFLVVGFVGGFGEGLIFTSLIVLLADTAHPSAMGRTIGLYRTFMDIGGVTGPVAFMLIYTNFDPHVAFLTAIGINLLNVGLLALVRTKSSLPIEESHSGSERNTSEKVG